MKIERHLEYYKLILTNCEDRKHLSSFTKGPRLWHHLIHSLLHNTLNGNMWLHAQTCLV